MDSPASRTRARTSRMASSGPTSSSPPSSPSTTSQRIYTTPITSTKPHHSPPYLPTATEQFLLIAYPTILLFGSLFSLLSPETRATPYDTAAQSHPQADSALLPSYFARKNNIFNTYFVKRGWAWVTISFLVFVFTHPALARRQAKIQAGVRWALVTGWWILVTQWCFGPALIDRNYRFTGGKCEVVQAQLKVEEGLGIESDVSTMVSAMACKSAGGSWQGGHDISGHVFLLVLGSWFLMQEVGWIYLRGRGRGTEERSVIMGDGAVKSASVEGKVLLRETDGEEVLGVGGMFAAGVVGLSFWMLLMTAIYFHTWFEKLTGLMVALTGIYAVYYLPRVIPAMRAYVGLPGI